MFGDAMHNFGIVRTVFRWLIFFAGLSLFFPGLVNASALAGLQKFALRVVEVHPNVVARRLGVQAAESGVDAARFQYWPSPAVQLNQLQDGGRTTSLIVSQPIWTGGRLDAGLSEAEARVYFADRAVLETQLALAVRAAELYQYYVVAQRRLAVHRMGLTRLEELTNMMERRIAGGVSPNIEKELADARLIQSRSDIVLEQTSSSTVFSQLQQLIGETIDPNSLDTQAGSFDFLLENDSVLIEKALAIHPVLQRAASEVEVSRAELEKQKSAVWPTLSLQFEHRTFSQNPNMDSNQAYLALQYQPGAGFGLGSQLAAAQNRLDGLIQTQEAIRREILEALSTELERYRGACARIPSLSKAVDSYKAILESYRRLFVAGKRGWLDVVNAARDLTQAELALSDLSATLEIASFRIKLRTGDMEWTHK